MIQENPTGWGPNTIPEQYKDMPYQPFSKGDRLGKVSSSEYMIMNRLMNSHPPDNLLTMTVTDIQ